MKPVENAYWSNRIVIFGGYKEWFEKQGIFQLKESEFGLIKRIEYFKPLIPILKKYSREKLIRHLLAKACCIVKGHCIIDETHRSQRSTKEKKGLISINYAECRHFRWKSTNVKYPAPTKIKNSTLKLRISYCNGNPPSQVHKYRYAFKYAIDDLDVLKQFIKLLQKQFNREVLTNGRVFVLVPHSIIPKMVKEQRAKEESVLPPQPPEPTQREVFASLKPTKNLATKIADYQASKKEE